MSQGSDDAVLVYLVIEEIITSHIMSLLMVIILLLKRENRKRKWNQTRKRYSLIQRMPDQIKHMARLVNVSDADCVSNLRMDRNTFGRLCLLLKGLGGLSDSKYVCVEEQVAMFLGILSHHKKNRVIGFDFRHSGETISKYIHAVLTAILKIHGVFLVKPSPVDNDCQDLRWKSFKGCLGALDGCHFGVSVPSADKPRFRNRKGNICTNTLAVCDPNLRFTYLLPGWEGSAADGRVLRDAVNRANGLKVPKGMYYLCDNGYANSEGFLTPYRGVRYHLKEWGPDSVKPSSPVELFNMRHTKARNVIERAFGILKMRWAILRSPSYYPLKVQIRLIMTCFLLHNFIRSEMARDPVEALLDDLGNEGVNEGIMESEEFVGQVECSPEWSLFRDELAASMWASYQA